MQHVTLIERNLPPSGVPLHRWLLTVLYLVSFILLGSAALLWALGYRVNSVTGALEQTALIQLDSREDALAPDVFINGVKQDGSLPFRKMWLSPGWYDIDVKKEGYQDWQTSVHLAPNERAVIGDIVLVYTEPKEVANPGLRLDELTTRSHDTSTIEIRNSNELWVDDKLLNRTSADIVQAEWYNDHRHIIFQAGTELLLENVGRHTSAHIITLTSEKPATYAFRDGGRLLVFADGDTIRAVELYAASSFIDRFTLR